MKAFLSLLTVLVARAAAQLVDCNIINDENNDFLDDAFIEYGIVPTIIPSAPTYLLNDIFGDYRSYLGNILPVCVTATPPITSWPGANQNVLYTLIAIVVDDLFASEANASITNQKLYGFVSNIPGGDILRGDTLVEYIPPNPPLGVSPLLYICLVYRQLGRIPITNALLLSLARNEYANFDVATFAQRNRLGNPIAGNFFRSKQTLCECRPEEETYCCCCTGNYRRNSPNGKGCSCYEYS